MKYGPMSLIVGFFLVGITVPIAVKDLDLFRAWPPDLAVFVQPVFWLAIVVVGWSLVRRMHHEPEPITMGLLVG